LSGTSRLWSLAVKATGREDLGLEVARHVDHATFQALGYALLASTNLQEAFERLLRYFAVVSDAGTLRLHTQATNTRLVIAPVDGPEQPAPQAIEALLYVIHRMGRQLFGPEFVLEQLSFAHPPPTNTQPYLRAFGCMPQFAAVENQLTVSRTVMDRALLTGNPDLARANEALLESVLEQIQRPEVVQRLRDHMVDQLASGEPSLNQLAPCLYMSPRTLQRQLAKHQTSFRTVLDELRQELAQNYLTNPKLSLSEVCFLLGFTELSSLNRACQRWFGRTPGHIRQTASRPDTT
jgi:AraC-like DNA-binding protein